MWPKAQKGRIPDGWERLLPTVKARIKLKVPRAREHQHKPTDDMRKMIGNMCAYGFRIEDILAVTKISSVTLYKYYGQEIKTARISQDLDVLNAAYLQAVGGPKKDWEKAKFPATKAYLEKRGLWQSDVPAQAVLPDLSRLTLDQLEQYQRLLQATDPRRLGHDTSGGGAGTPKAED